MEKGGRLPPVLAELAAAQAESPQLQQVSKPCAKSAAPRLRAGSSTLPWMIVIEPRKRSITITRGHVQRSCASRGRALLAQTARLVECGHSAWALGQLASSARAWRRLFHSGVPATNTLATTAVRGDLGPT